MLQSIDGLRVQIYKENASYFRFNQFFFRLGLQLELSDRHRRRSHPGRYRPACGKHLSSVCGYVYDPAEHDGVAFEDLPDDWRCPRCKQGKEKFNRA